jgi:Linalool dehydratase/isomerase
MVSLYSMLFDDDKYDEPESLTFNYDPIFYGMGPEKYVYNRTSLQQTILTEFERNDFLGVCCEPNCIFVICHQFPLIAMRYNDVRNGTSVVEPVLEKYMATCEKRGMFDEQLGQIVCFWLVEQQKIVPGGSVWTSAYLSRSSDDSANAFMNSWNPLAVRKGYLSQLMGYVQRHPSGRTSLNPNPIAQIIWRNLVAEDPSVDPSSEETAAVAWEEFRTLSDNPKIVQKEPQMGYVVQWVSEVGDTETLNGLLKHADEYLNPTWENGGLFYKRNNTLVDEHGNNIFMDPYTGNAAI